MAVNPPPDSKAIAVPSLAITYDISINYAFQQNAIPVIKELLFKNDGKPRKDLIIRVTTEPAFAAPAELRLQSIDANGEFRVAPVDLKLSHDFLANLNERVAGWLNLEVLEGGLVVVARKDPIALLARNEWCGLTSLPEILAAFVLPNDPAVMPILSRAAFLLREATGRASFNGYQDKNKQRAWQQLASIYKAIADLGIRYINPPASFESTGQKVRFPSEIVNERFGTCLDIALLFAACCEQAGLAPMVLMHDGHAYAGCWLEGQTLPDSSTDDLQHVRKLAVDELITVFEVTAVTQEAPTTLRDAEHLAKAHLETTQAFRSALDIRRSRGAKIRPLPIPGKSSFGSGVDPGSPSPVVGIGERDFAIPLDATKPAPRTLTRIDQWKGRLLDLTLRNRFLNFKETKGMIRLLAPPLSVEKELGDRALALKPRPKVMGSTDPRDSQTYTKQQLEDALESHIHEEIQQGRIHTDLEDSEHSRRLTDLYRAARSALEENGANTLFVAIGMLEWREAEHSDRVLRAPILLVPVQVKRRSVLEGFTLSRIDEETRLNVTLIEMMRQNFEKEIPGLDPLPENDAGVDVGRVMQLVREAVRDLAGWEVKLDLFLGQFSFTKFLLWRDLNDRLDALKRSRVVRHLVDDAGSQYPNPQEDILPAQLDDDFDPKDIFCPRSADSSQLAAIMAAAAGHDFVLEGPPGTGKSQTITNIIAHCLATGKRVLFVAEKRTALEVVHRRLKESGLDPFCLELHSNKTGKNEVLAQFSESLKFVSANASADWSRRSAELLRLRNALNGYTRALHKRHLCGLSAYSCLDYLLPRQDEPTVPLYNMPALLEMKAEDLEKARQLARRLQERSRAVVPLSAHPLEPLACEDWSPRWAAKNHDRMLAIRALLQPAAEASRNLFESLGYPNPWASTDQLANFYAMVASLLSPEPVPSILITGNWGTAEQQLNKWISLSRERTGLRTKLSGYSERELLALDLAAIKATWISSQDVWILLKWLRKRRVRRHLQTARPDKTLPAADNLAEIVDAALRLREVNAAMEKDSAAATALLGAFWKQSEPDPDILIRVRNWLEKLHLRMEAFGKDNPTSLGNVQMTIARYSTKGSLALPLARKSAINS